MVSEVEAPHASLELEGHVRGQVEADEIPADVERFLPVRSTLIVLTAVFVCVAALSKDKHRLPCQPGVRDRGFFSEHGVTARRILE